MFIEIALTVIVISAVGALAACVVVWFTFSILFLGRLRCSDAERFESLGGWSVIGGDDAITSPFRRFIDDRAYTTIEDPIARRLALIATKAHALFPYVLVIALIVVLIGGLVAYYE